MRKGSIPAVLVMAVLLIGVTAPMRAGAGESLAPRTLDREDDPVVVPGGKMPSFSQMALDQLFVYAYKGGVWQQIPWQFDEVVDGRLTDTEDGLLDDDDELVLMGSDTGDRAPSGSWIDNADSRKYPRQEISVTDPISPAKKGWVYVYRSTTDTEAVTADYANFDLAQWVFTAERYIVGITPNRYSVNRLEMNGGGVDIIDRTKIRAYAPTMFSYIITEDTLQIMNPVVRDGRVRAYVANYDATLNVITSAALIGYRSAIQLDFTMDFSAWLSKIDWIRLSADLSSDAVGSTYYDANTSGGVTVDGQPDAVAATPPTDWWQVSGDSGTVVQIADVSRLGGTRTNYHKDDETIDPDDTGDQRSYSDCGAYLVDADPNLTFKLWYNVLPADQPNVGATHLAHARQPLRPKATKQFALTVTKAGDGKGSVSPDMGTIKWAGKTGTGTYNAGKSVTLTAKAKRGSELVGWSGACSSAGTNPDCTIKMRSAKKARASLMLRVSLSS